MSEKYFYRIEIYGRHNKESAWQICGYSPGGPTYDEAIAKLKKEYKESHEPCRNSATNLRYKIIEVITKESPVFEINSPDDWTAFLLAN
jgi:hypothetical protein